MNIAEAKDYIKNTVSLYLKKDEYGDYRIPVMRQRPVFLLGAPGIGKTAIMEQIASELGIALVSYSMTHHTRQSALGLPFIKQKEYGGKEYDVSEYTMSEIIASIYETMEESGCKEGILFLDEINCVSETLAPSILQFLQYKVFGRHSVPEGWVIVTAGNPVEYNKSVREFDVVTLDRLKVLDVSADYNAWKLYAREKGLHAAILNFLENHRDYFYVMETTVDGRSYVTARGWEDLSEIIFLYEEDRIKVTESLVSQYLRNDKVVREFTAYYDLFNKYKTDYRVEALLDGKISDTIVDKASGASFDERLSLAGLLLDKVSDEIKTIMNESDDLREIMPAMKNILASDNVAAALRTQADARNTIIVNRSRAGSLTPSERNKHKRIEALFLAMLDAVNAADNDDAETTAVDNGNAATVVKKIYNNRAASLKEDVVKEQTRLHYLFEFATKAFGEDSNEMLVLVTELTLGVHTASFLNTFGSEDYDRLNSLVMVSDRKENLRAEIGKHFGEME